MSKRTAQNTLPGLRNPRGPIYIAAPGGREDHCWETDRDPQTRRWRLGPLGRDAAGRSWPLSRALHPHGLTLAGWRVRLSGFDGLDLSPGAIASRRGRRVAGGDLLLTSAPWSYREALAGALARAGWGPVYYDGREYKLSRVEGAA